MKSVMLAKAKKMPVGTIRKYGASFYKKTTNKGWQRVPTGEGRAAFTKQENKKAKFIPTGQNLIFAFEDLKPPTPLSDLKARKYVIDKGYVKKTKDGFKLTNKGTERYLELKRGKKEGRAKRLAKEYTKHEETVIGIIKQQQKKIDEEKGKVGVSQEVIKFMDKWTFDPDKATLNIIPKIERELSKYKPTKSVKLYRAQKIGDKLNRYTSWTYKKEMALSMIGMPVKDFGPRKKNQEVISKTISPKDILLDFTKLPEKVRKNYLNEIIVKPIEKLKPTEKPVKKKVQIKKIPTKINVKTKTQEYVDQIKNISIMNESGKKVYIELIKEAIKNKDKAMLNQYLKEVKNWIERNKKFKQGKKVGLIKAKYIKRWKGKDGKWKYEYFREKVDRKKTVETFSTKVRQKEDEIANLKYEKCYIFDKSGKVLFEKSGEKNSITFNDKEISKIEGAELFTHNHPMGVSFSPEDIKFLWANNCKEIRTVGKEYTYSAKINTFWSKSFWIGFIDELVTTVDNVRNIFEDRIGKGLMTTREAEQNHWHDVWSKLSKSHNTLEYKRERR